MKRILFPLGLILALAPSAAIADEVLDWHRIMFDAAIVAPATSPTTMARNAAIVHAAVFDAVNGVRPLYESIHVQPNAAMTDGASARAAAVQAAYVILTKLYPSQSFDTRLSNSLNAIADSAAAIAAGVAWGQHVADQMWAFAETDGFSVTPPPYTGGTALGEWRSLANPPASGAGLQIPGMRPWVLKSASQFRPEPPPALDTERYAVDFNETMLTTSLTVANPSSPEAQYSWFWNRGTAPQLWGSAALGLAEGHGLTLSQNARFFAQLTIALSDAMIGCWEAKYTYNFWRPMTANAFALEDGNAGTGPHAGWTTLFTTPNHPDYPSGHSCLSGAASQILSRYFGNNTPVTFVQNVSVPEHDDPDTRSFSSASEALEEIKNARIFSGIHFRSATEAGTRLGKSVANHVLSHAMRPLQGGNKIGHILE